MTNSNKDPRGYRPITSSGPRIRADVVDVYIFRAATEREERARALEWNPAASTSNPKFMLLQLLRTRDPLKNTWHPIMGHIEGTESAPQCALRELNEEVGLTPQNPALLALFALEQIHPFYIAAIDSIVMSPRFAAEVTPDWQPTLNAENSAARWVHEDDLASHFMWPGQQSSCRELLTTVARPNALARQYLRIPLNS